MEEEIKILKIEKERKGQVENLIKDTKDCKVNPENEKNVELIGVNYLKATAPPAPQPSQNFGPCSRPVEDKLEKMNTLNRRLSIFFQDLFIIESGLDTFEEDSFDTRMKKIVPEKPNILAMLVQNGLHFQYIQLKMENVLEFIEILRNQMKKIQSKEGFKNKETERRECPKFSLDNPWESIHDSFRYIYEEILSLKYDLEKFLDYLDKDE